MFVYKVNEMSLYWFHSMQDKSKSSPEYIRYAVGAALAIREKVDNFKEWDGYGEYWFAPLPMTTKPVVCCRPEWNPHSSAYVVSEVELPWMGKSL